MNNDVLSNPMMKIILGGAIISLVIAIIIGAIIVGILGINILGLGTGLIAILIVSGVVFGILMTLTVILAIIIFATRDVGKKFQRTESNKYKPFQQQEVGKTVQTRKEPEQK